MAQTVRTPGLLVFAPAIGRPIGELFEAAGVNFVDLAGNLHLHLRLGDRLARVQGRVLKAAPVDKGMRPPAYRVLFALLAEPLLVDASTRVLGQAQRLQTKAGLSPGPASGVSRSVAKHTIGRGAAKGWGPRIGKS